jgi:Kef-type K+ transport system membrane component KefB
LPGRHCDGRLMPISPGLNSLLVIVLIAALTPLIITRIPGPKIPEVVVLLVLGILVGPQALGIAHFSPSIDLLSNFGLGMLFFLAGFELDRMALLGRSGRIASAAWIISILVSMMAVGALAGIGFVHAFLPISIALTTTALGTLLPMLRDTGENHGVFGGAILANGAVGELLPIVAISLFLGSQGTWAALGLLVAFAVLAVAAGRAVTQLRGRKIAALIQEGSTTSSQTTVRFAVLLLVTLLLISARLGLDAILGAFAAGIVLRAALPDGDEALEHKLDGLAFGFFIPVFFVVSGMALDVKSVVADPARMLVFFVLLLVIRGGPIVLIYRRWMGGRGALRLGLYSATSLPLIVAITEIGRQTHVMRADNAAALVGAGLLSVACFPMLARMIPYEPPTEEPELAPVPATE